MQEFTAKQYMQIDIANSFGLDKLTWNQRLEWFEQNKLNLMSKLKEAENPAMFYAGVTAWNKIQNGEASGYPVSLDATSSGMQILSVLTGDRKAAVLTNVIENPQDKRSNAYQELYDTMQRRVGSNVKLQYADLKRCIMTAFYGSEAVPKEIFGEGKMLGAFFATLEEEAPFIWELNKAFLAMWDPTALKYSWIMPDNFHVHIKVNDHIQEDVNFMGETIATFQKVNKAVPTGRSLGANVTHSIDGLIVRELMRRCNYDPARIAEVQIAVTNGACGKNPSPNSHLVSKLWTLFQQSGFLSARILDYLDSTNIHMVDPDTIQDLLNSLPKKPFEILAVHDCFRVLPNYGNDLRKQYNLQLALIAQSDMLSFILTKLLNKPITINKNSNFEAEILDANYALS